MEYPTNKHQMQNQISEPVFRSPKSNIYMLGQYIFIRAMQPIAVDQEKSNRAET